MKKIADLPILKLIGNTPLYRLPLKGCAEVWIKLEGVNPGGSIKDRAALGMLKKAEEAGLLRENTVIVEPTSGNTGIGLALLGSALGLKVILTMPDSMSVERRTILKAYGAELVLTPAKDGMAGAVAEAKRILAENENAIMLDQFANTGNVWAHETMTGPEIIRALPNDKHIDTFVASFGTGGTVSGIGRAMKKVYKDLKVVAVEPASSPLITKGEAGPHKIQGIGANFVPDNLDRETVDDFMTVTDEDALTMTKRLAAEFGLFSGISTGANVCAAIRIARNLPEDYVVVTVQPDRGEKYLSVF